MRHAIYLIGNSPESRARAAMAINEVPDGWVVEIRPRKSHEQSMQKPKCFDKQADWDLYCRDSWAIDADPSLFCRDCTDARRNQMIQEHRCAWPDTVFVLRRDDGVVGIRRDEQAWYGALTGQYLNSGKRSPNVPVAPASAATFEGESKC